MRSAAAAIALLGSALVAATPIEFESGKPDGALIKIISASTSGNGCPQGTVTTDLSPDGTVRCGSCRLRDRERRKEKMAS